MTIAKHVGSSTEVSKREVFSPPVLVSFQHSQLKCYIFHTLFQHFFSCVPAVFAREKFACKPMCSSTKRVVFSTVLRAFLLCSSTLFCVRFYCVPALNACKVTTFRHRFACISTVLQHFARAFQYFLHVILLYVNTFCVYFYRVPVLSACISPVLSCIFARQTCWSTVDMHAINVSNALLVQFRTFRIQN